MTTQLLTVDGFKTTLEGMKKLGQDKQISYRSTPEIVSHLDLAAAKLAVVDQFDGEKLQTGHLVNAVALWLGRLELAELQEFATPKVRALEAYLRGDDASVPDPEPLAKKSVGARLGKLSGGHANGEDPAVDGPRVPKRRG